MLARSIPFLPPNATAPAELKFELSKCTHTTPQCAMALFDCIHLYVFCFVLFGLQLSVCLWWLQVPLRDLSDA